MFIEVGIRTTKGIPRLTKAIELDSTRVGAKTMEVEGNLGEREREKKRRPIESEGE